MTSKADFERAASYRPDPASAYEHTLYGVIGGWRIALRHIQSSVATRFMLKIFNGRRLSETISHGARSRIIWRTHYLPSCLVERMAVAVLYLLQFKHLGLAGLLDTARFDTSGSWART